jgi:hypothetical protein
VQHTDRRQRLIQFSDNGLRRRIHQLNPAHQKRFTVQTGFAFFWGMSVSHFIIMLCLTEFAFPPPYPSVKEFPPQRTPAPVLSCGEITGLDVVSCWACQTRPNRVFSLSRTTRSTAGSTRAVHLRSKSSPLQSPKSTNELQDQRPDGNKNPDGNKGCQIETTRRELFRFRV